MSKKFEVQIYYTGFSTHLIDAESEEEAILKARSQKIKLREFCSNLENWEEADQAEEIKNGAEKDKNENTI